MRASSSLQFNYLAEDISEAFLARAQTVWGKLELVAIFAGFWRSFDASAGYPLVVLAIALCTFAPRYRWHIAALATLSVFALNPFWFDPSLPEFVAAQEGMENRINFDLLQYGMALFFFCFALAVIACKRRFGHVRPLRRPIAVLLSLYFALVLVASLHICHGLIQVLLWSFIAIFGGYFWFLGYAVLDGNSTTAPLLLRIGTFHPFWGSSTTPIGKGVGYLRNVEAKDAAGFALIQIKGVRLIIVCSILHLSLACFDYVVHTYFKLPSLDEALAHEMVGAPFAPASCWGSLLASFVETILNMAVWGNSIVACARMAGFNLLRNTYKPLQSQTLAIFWNRFYFYFKELLVDFFFYPAFLRYFRRHRRLRIIFATFMAAFVGNIIFHFMRDIDLVLRVGLVQAIARFQTYAFYCFLLATGIAVSQLRPRSSVRGGRLGKAQFSSSGVVAFFCLISIFDDRGEYRIPLTAALTFLSHLFW